MRIRTICAIAACRLTRSVMRLLHRGGTALPGKAARLFDPDILDRVSEGMEIIVVTGTNGKTTTCSMLEQAYRGSGRTCLSNKSGANLLSGITAELTCNAAWSGKPKTHYAVIECDEGALKQVTGHIRPKVIAVTNLFRDQLDRYGEVTHTLDEIRRGILASPDSILCLNADDSLVSSLAENVPGRVLYYGMDSAVGEQEDPVLSDAKYCIRCGAQYRYDYHTYAHLGGFRCPACGYRRHEADCALTKILEMSPRGSRGILRLPSAAVSSREPETELRVGLPAVYNLYNALAAICAYTACGYPAGEILSSLKTVHSSFGRMEHFTLGDVPVQMILVKNPAGCNQALTYLTGAGQPYRLLLCLNDRTADGHDISWIWDAEYEKLAADGNLKQILVAGDRAEDMQLRLKYAGVAPEDITLVREPAQTLPWIEASPHPVFALPNYTSMLELREALRQKTGEREFWE
ncbi:MAG: DUF1727 domain-containing protein [Lachnospiraceae bacterium]|nr:DUF1727 domain-containing protein [Lachnospiraceae bacterium]